MKVAFKIQSRKKDAPPSLSNISSVVGVGELLGFVNLLSALK